MQLKMAPGELAYRELFGQAPDQAAKPKAPKGRKQVSQPVDADDLRRRLYSVISQREIAKEKRRLARAEEAARKAEETPERSTATSRGGQQAAEGGILADVSNQQQNIQVRGPSGSSNVPQPSGDIQPSMNDAMRRSPSRKGATAQQTQGRSGTSEPYIPTEAAEQFARTATAQNPKNKSRVHDLSREALRLHTETLPAGQGHALRKVQSERERLRERNQFQNTRVLEDTAAIDTLRDPKQRHSVPNRDQYSDWAAPHRRYSTRRSLQCEEHAPLRAVRSNDTIPEGQVVAAGGVNPSNYHMVDWSQSDETQDQSRGMRSPLLKKADSLWGLKDRFAKPAPAERSTTALDLSEKVDAMVPKPMKKGFWTKIKRQVAAVHV